MIRKLLRSTLLPVVLLGAPLLALPRSVNAEEVRVRVGEPFPALVVPALADGSPLSIEQFRGRKVLLHQFASW